MIARCFYAPSDRLVGVTSARLRRAVAFWLLAVWLGPGTAAWLLLRDSLPFVGFMSIFALWWTGFSAFSAETPVEAE